MRLHEVTSQISQPSQKTGGPSPGSAQRPVESPRAAEEEKQVAPSRKGVGGGGESLKARQTALGARDLGALRHGWLASPPHGRQPLGELRGR